MDVLYQEPFRQILRRIYAPSNQKRYQSIFAKRENEDEERLYFLCQKFWSPENQVLDIESYIVNDTLNAQTAMRDIAEIKQLLDKLGWKK